MFAQKYAKDPALASVQGNLATSAVAQQDVTAATDADKNSNDKNDLAALAAYRKAKKKGEKKKSG